ncbi:hypothetical protein EVAR_100868_1 [Eumeta japonica]|uniref:Uncharacterized protein n=1 Tax=Eumeta variegata TaxID=151549 RepID=A0A4C1T393_EUMVA|nr:hypothetical protein EVAR_100868_1 [Eumeta japonica]
MQRVVPARDAQLTSSCWKKSKESLTTSRLVDAECDGIPALSLVGRDSTQDDYIFSYIVRDEWIPASQPESIAPSARANLNCN